MKDLSLVLFVLIVFLIVFVVLPAAPVLAAIGSC